MDLIVGGWLSLCVGIAVYSLVRLPTWLCSAINRSCLWALRDVIYDARRRGEIPDSAEVALLLERVETAIIVVSEISGLQLWWLQRKYATEKADTQPLIIAADKYMSPDEAYRFLLFQYELFRIIARQYLIGSWSSILLVAPRRLRVLWHTLRGTRLVSPSVSKDESPQGLGLPSTENSQVREEQIEAEVTIAQRVEDALSHLQISRDDEDLAGAAT